MAQLNTQQKEQLKFDQKRLALQYAYDINQKPRRYEDLTVISKPLAKKNVKVEFTKTILADAEAIFKWLKV